MGRSSPMEIVARSEYRRRNLTCEYTLACGEFVRWEYIPGKLQLDHIWGRRGRREDVESSANYMMASPGAHAWKTNHSVVGRIVACWWKFACGDFDRELIGRVMPRGNDPVGWVEAQLMARETIVPQWARDMAEDFLSRF